MKYPTLEINSVNDLLDHLKIHIHNINGPTWFRGQSNGLWKLLPSIYRGIQPTESHFLSKFKQSATLILNHQPKTSFEWMFLMQHYGVKTRLLDWSENPLIALYFVVSSKKNLRKDGALWVLHPNKLNKLAGYSGSGYKYEIPSFESDNLETYTPVSLSSKITTELNPIAAIATRNNSRMQAQMGVFTIHHNKRIPIEDLGDGNHLWQYKIPSSAKKNIIKELKLLGISEFGIFPELEHLILE